MDFTLSTPLPTVFFIPAGMDSDPACVQIEVHNDVVLEFDETISIALTHLSPATGVTVSQNTTVVTIVDDEGMS